MFTGIIEEIGTVKLIKKGAKSLALTVDCCKVLEDIKLGDSIAVNGVCLTANSFNKDSFTADIMFETMNKSALSRLKSGDKLNLERAMSANGRFGGHFVSGHIDGTGIIMNKQTIDIAIIFTISASSEILEFIIPKGSIAIDGISLTVIDITENDFTVSIIPHTGTNTTLLEKKLGEPVNLENDMIAKYIKRFASGNKNKETIDLNFLAKNGF
ncbi:MAG: riboflavin synthase [Erysipelotrichales bacterium]|nr:riboflavin synthase [Erysipelotrichales bacterium]